MSEPVTDYVRLKELEGALKTRGFSAYEVGQLIRSGVIEKKRFRTDGCSYYHWPSVAAALQLNGNSGKSSPT